MTPGGRHYFSKYAELPYLLDHGYGGFFHDGSELAQKYGLTGGDIALVTHQASRVLMDR
jgi:hypothetical protein